LIPAIERNRTHTKKIGQLNSIKRLISELLIFVKLVLKINNKVLEAQVTSVQQVFFLTAQFPEKWLQMRCGLLALNA